jgi:ribosome maturation factor RimP
MANREKITELLGPKLSELGCFLVDIRINPSINKYEVFIDSDEGVTIEACEKLSRYLQFCMDNDTSFPQNYTLDVSSPGMDNPFKVMRQYTKNIGKEVEVLLNNGLKKEGILLEVTESDLKLAVHHPPKKKGMKPEVTEELFVFEDIKSTKNKISF